MIHAIGKLFAANSVGHLGTAWICAPGMALTAFHCVGDRRSGRLGDGPFEVEFAALPRASAMVAWSDPVLDVALLTLGEHPPGVDPIWPGPRADPSLSWTAYGYPVGYPSGLHLSGRITSTRGNVDGHVSFQLDCDQGGQGFLEGTSGAAICQSGRVIGLLRHGALAQRVIFATPIDDVLAACPLLNDAVKPARATAHRLHRFPRYGQALDCRITPALRQVFIDHYQSFHEASELIDEAVFERRQADPGDDVPVLQMSNLPDIHYATRKGFWFDTILESQRKGTRMLAALVLNVPDDYYTGPARADRDALMQCLANLPG